MFSLSSSSTLTRASIAASRKLFGNMTKTSRPISTIIFDVDDTLYDVASGFTAHRNGEVIWRYMVERHGFASEQEARAVRDEYFAKYHSTAKALTVAQADGRFPNSEAGKIPFDAGDMSQYWVENLDYSKLWGNHCYESVDASKKATQEFAAALKDCPLRKVAFSNGPKAYVTKVLDTLGYLPLFSTRQDESLYIGDREYSGDGAYVWGVDDVLPHCKPEKEAFEKIFGQLGGVDAADCIMVEDSMKNVRAAKALGMKTILITGSREEGRILEEDAPTADDPAVDVALVTVEEMATKLPGLFRNPPVFEPPSE